MANDGWFVICIGLVPIIMFFIFTAAPTTGSREELRFAHAILLSVHILVFAAAGALGNLALIRELRLRVAISSIKEQSEDERTT